MSITAGLVVKSKMLLKNDIITMLMLSFTETFNSFPIHQFSHFFQIGKIDNIRVQMVSTMILCYEFVKPKLSVIPLLRANLSKI